MSVPRPIPPAPQTNIGGTEGLTDAKIVIATRPYVTLCLPDTTRRTIVHLLRRQRTASNDGGHYVELAPVDRRGQDKNPVNEKTASCEGMQNRLSLSRSNETVHGRRDRKICAAANGNNLIIVIVMP